MFPIRLVAERNYKEVEGYLLVTRQLLICGNTRFVALSWTRMATMAETRAWLDSDRSGVVE